MALFTQKNKKLHWKSYTETSPKSTQVREIGFVVDTKGDQKVLRTGRTQQRKGDGGL